MSQRKVVEIEINGEQIYFETDDAFSENDTIKVGVEDAIENATGTFKKALSTIRLVVASTVQQVRDFDRAIAPDEFELQFGIKISGEYGAVVAKASGESQLQIKMTYKHKKEI